MQVFWLSLAVGICAASLQACTGATPIVQATPSDEPTLDATPSATPAHTSTPASTPTPTPIRTPPALPGPFTSTVLNPNDTPHPYLADACPYLRAKWTPSNSPPGTLVMVIMFHSITGGAVTNPSQISEEGFHSLMDGLKEQGFEAITTAQLANFLERNARIPRLSALLLADDRHYAQFFDENFRPYWERYHWPVVNAWISAKDTPAGLWDENVALEKEGWVDHQAHGVVHNTPIGDGTSDAFALGELQGSVDAFQAHFGKKPIAFIWPGGGFSRRAAELARQVGYRLGFTVNPRGPLMFNWIPLSDVKDPRRPSYMPEGPVGDPLMVLPRYWDTDALKYLPDIVGLSREAAAYAERGRAAELEYYDIVCAPKSGPIPGL